MSDNDNSTGVSGQIGPFQSNEFSTAPAPLPDGELQRESSEIRIRAYDAHTRRIAVVSDIAREVLKPVVRQLLLIAMTIGVTIVTSTYLLVR